MASTRIRARDPDKKTAATDSMDPAAAGPLGGSVLSLTHAVKMPQTGRPAIT